MELAMRIPVMATTSLPAVLAAIPACVFSLTALAADPPPAAVAPTQAAAATVDKVAGPAAASARSDKSYTPPSGFKTKVRRDGTVYCRSRAPLGTRLKREECFTEAEIKAVERAMAISTEDTQQRGRMCNSGMMCTGQGGG